MRRIAISYTSLSPGSVPHGSRRRKIGRGLGPAPRFDPDHIAHRNLNRGPEVQSIKSGLTRGNLAQHVLDRLERVSHVLNSGWRRQHRHKHLSPLRLHPGTAVRAYLAGARQPFTNPGRYLLVGAIVTTVASAALQGIGAPDHNIGRFAVHVAQGFTKGAAEDSGEAATASLEGTAWSAAVQDLEQLGAYPALALVLIAGLVGLLYWALFRRDTNVPAEAFAVGTYATAHAVILYQSTNVVFEFLVHYGALEAGISTTFEWALRVLPLCLSRCSYVRMLWGERVERNQGRPRIGMGIH